MTERLVSIQVPKSIATEVKNWMDSGDWLSAKINKRTADEIVRVLIEQGFIDEGDNVDVIFSSDENMKENEPKRKIWISDLRMDEDTEIEENKRLVIFEPDIDQFNN